MKKIFFSVVHLLKRFLGVREFRMLVILLLREAIALALFSLAAILSLESILPGTISLRESVLFFILGTAFALSLERILSKTLPPTRETPVHTSTKTRFLIWGFFLWTTILFANALLGFHPAIIAGTVVLTMILFRAFFVALFEKTGGA